MKILVIGGGAVGELLCRFLAKEKEVKLITCCDVKDVKFKDKKIIFQKIDILDKKKFDSFLEKNKHSYLINAASSIFNLSLMESCCKHGMNYMDMSSMWEHDPNKKARAPYKVEQFDYDKKFKNKKIFGLINAGVAPGLDSVLAKECEDDLDEIDNIKIRFIDDSGSKTMYFSWSKEVLLDELASKPLIFQNGKFKMMEAFSGIEEFEFPKPFGKKTVNLICQEEAGTIPLYVKTKNLDVKDYDDHMPKQKVLYELGLISKDEIKLGGYRISPLEFTSRVLPPVASNEEIKGYKNAQFAMLVEGEGKKDNKKLTVRYWLVFPNQGELNKMKVAANFMNYSTAVSAKLFVLALPKIKQIGVFPPEGLNKEIRDEVVDGIKKYCKFKKEIFKK